MLMQNVQAITRRRVTPVSLATPAYSIDGTDLTTYTLSSWKSQGGAADATPFGAAAAGRYVFAAFHGTKATAGTLASSSATIGGVAATKVVDVQSSLNALAVYKAAVPTDADLTAAITWATGCLRCQAMVIGVYDSDGTVSDSGSGTSNPISDAGIVVPAGGALIGFAFDAGNTTVTWTGITERIDTYDAGAEGNTITCASDDFAAGQSVAVTCTFAAATTLGGYLFSVGPNG